MALGIVSAQRREDISNFQTTDWRDGGWYCEQGKGNAKKGGAGHGGRKVFIPGDLRLECFGMSLEEAYRQCRSTRVFTKYVIHHPVSRGPHCKVGAQVHLDSLTTRFHDEVLALGIDWGDKKPPTFHEIRSLSERLYKAQGGVNTKDLLGHKDEKMTEKYDDDRGLDWLRVSVVRTG
jgi:integrase